MDEIERLRRDLGRTDDGGWQNIPSSETEARLRRLVALLEPRAGVGPEPTITRSQLRDVEWVQQNWPVVTRALQHGKIIDDIAQGVGKEPIR
jgi:hypothetical protein